MSLKKKLKNQGLLDEDEQHYWKCGCCYINDNVLHFTTAHS